MKRNSVFNFTLRFVGIFCAILLLANIALGVILLGNSRAALNTSLNNHMLSIVNTAADVLDGDVMAAYAGDDAALFSAVSEQLLVFQLNADIKYIYTVKKVGEDSFMFLIDPDPIDPAAYGEAVVLSDALISAGNGVAAVDSRSVTDRWGSHYSAYSPVFDSAGRIACIVGIDFIPDWYEQQLRRTTVSMIVVSAVSIVVCAVIIFLLMNVLGRRFRTLSRDISELSRSVDELTDELSAGSGAGDKGDPAHTLQDDGVTDELETLSMRIGSMHEEMKRYIEHAHAKAYTDSLTGVGNSTAYHESIRALDEKIAAGNASFTVGLCDIDSLKKINDNYGHEEGDIIIAAAASALAAVYGRDRVYRVGGDEFVVITEDAGADRVLERQQAVESYIERYNTDSVSKARLALSCGWVSYAPGSDSSYREVFARADEAMYKVKAERHCCR